MIAATSNHASASDHGKTQQLLLQLLEDRQEHSIEELSETASGISWAQLFSAMDSLSRCGSIELRRQGFTYWLRKAQPRVEGGGSADAAANSHHR